MNDALRIVDGRAVLRMERRLAHRPEKVWRAITEPAHLSAWYPFQVVQLEPQVGGKIVVDGGDGTTLDGTVTEFDPPRRFAFTEDGGAVQPREGINHLHFELRPEGDGCLLVFTHTFHDRPHAAANAAGWDVCLDAMAAALDGRPAPAADDFAERHEAYVKAFGLDQGTAGATADGWQVRFERQLMQQPVEKVWATLTAPGPDGPPGAAGDLTPGGPVPQALTTERFPAGTVTEVHAPTLLTYDWHAGGRPAGTVRLELTSTPAGARILLTQTGPATLEGGQAAALDTWRTHIERLVEQVLAAGG